GRRSFPVARRASRVPRHSRRYGHTARGALRNRRKHDRQRRSDRARLRANRRAAASAWCQNRTGGGTPRLVTIISESETVDDFAAFGIRAFTTSRLSGSFGLASEEPTAQVMRRWWQLRDELVPGGVRVASGSQVHGARVIVHGSTWEGWLRVDAADGHVSTDRGLALVVTVADC